MWGCCPPIFRHGIPWGLESLSASIQLHTALQRGRGPEMGLMFFCTKKVSKMVSQKMFVFRSQLNPDRYVGCVKRTKEHLACTFALPTWVRRRRGATRFAAPPPGKQFHTMDHLWDFTSPWYFQICCTFGIWALPEMLLALFWKKFYNNERFLMAAIWTNACNKQLFPLEPMHAVILTTFVWSAWPEISWIGEPKNILNWWHLAQTHTSYAIG